MRKPRCDILYNEKKFYHVYNRGHHKMKVFRCEDDYSQFLYLMRKYLKEFDLELICYCLLPNHYHMLLKLGSHKTHISKFFQSFMTAYCCYFNRKYRLLGSVFQGRFQARQIEDRRDYLNIVKYMEDNPKESDLIEEGEDYRWFYRRKGWSRLKV